MTETTLSKIDDLVLAPKAIAGIVSWKHEERPQSSNWAFAAPLSIDGTFVDGMTLHGRAAGTDGWLHLSLVIMEIPVERVWYLPPRAHTNKSPSWAPQILHRLYIPRLKNRRYAWEDNRVLPHDRFQEIAAPIEANLIDRAAAINYSLKVMNIIGTVPAPEFNPMLAL